MRAVIQRVTRAAVRIENEVNGSIGTGVLILLGITGDDTPEDAAWLAGKISRLRIFADEQGVMNRSLLEAGGEVLVVSQFTLHASIKKGNRPFYGLAAGPETAIPLYEEFCRAMEQETGQPVATGRFGANMQVSLENDGPVTILMDSKRIE